MNRKRQDSKISENAENGFAAWGGYMESKKLKLLEQFRDATNNSINKESNLFNGISIFVNGYTNPTAEELKQIMALHGGEYHNYYNSARTTYIIASNLPDAKIKQIGPNKKIIKPEWVTDCLKSGKLVDYSKYLLYTNCNRKQPKLNFKKLVKVEESKLPIVDENQENSQFSPELFDSDEDNLDTNIKLNPILPNDGRSSNSEINKNDLELSKAKNSTVEKSSRTLNANDPKFLSEFYNNSRLHHISTLGATFKQHVSNLREESNFKFPERQKFVEYIKSIDRKKSSFLLATKESIIMHIDMDCFFVSVGLRKRPELKGVPVAVTHSKGGQEPSFRSGVDRQAELDCYKKRIQEKLNLKSTELGPGNMSKRLDGIENQSMSEIASCSYEARKSGVKNGMFMGTALKLCPNLQTIPYDFDGYKEVAYTLYNTISEYTLNIEAVSCDEMFVDVTELLNDTGANVSEWATYIRSLIQSRTGCSCSTGFGQNRLQARIATKTAKPNGQFHLIPSAVEEYMVDIKVDDLPGVGRSTSLKLESFGVKTCGDLQSMSISQLRSEFGNKIGESLYNHCRGIDDRKLVYEHERKSVSAEVNYGIRFKHNTEAEKFLKQLVEEVHTRLTEIKMKGKNITLKLMVKSKDAPDESSKFMGHGICDHVTKSNTLPIATNELNVIEREILSIAQKLSIPPEDLRGIGIQISKLEKIKNMSGGISKFFRTSNSPEVNTNKIVQNNTLSDNFKNNYIDWESKIDNISSKAITMNEISKTKQNSLHIRNLFNTKQNEQKNIDFANLFNEKNLPEKKFSLVRNNSFEKTSPEKKISPVKNCKVGSIKKGRGRSKGSRGGRTIERKPSNNGNLKNYFTVPTTPTSITYQQEIELDGIDMEVFDALPEDIKNEIRREYLLHNNHTDNIAFGSAQKRVYEPNIVDEESINDKITNNLEEQQDNAQIETEFEKSNFHNIPSTSKEDSHDSETGMFFKMNIKEIKILIETWISSQNIPESCDIKMLGEYFKQLALDRKIGMLFEILKFLFSEISFKNDCNWHKAYFEIVSIAQEGMKEQYGSRIYIYKDFKCKNMCRLHNK